MSSLNDLRALPDSPINFEHWIGQFDDQAQDLIIDSIIYKNCPAVFEILSTLDNNPYPFNLITLENHRNKLLRGEL